MRSGHQPAGVARGGRARAQEKLHRREKARSAIAKRAGAARMKKLTAEQRSDIARKAVAAREAKRAAKAKPPICLHANASSFGLPW